MSAHEEFDCADCGRHIVRIIPSAEGAYCAECLHYPGWFEVPLLCWVLDRELWWEWLSAAFVGTDLLENGRTA